MYDDYAEIINGEDPKRNNYININFDEQTNGTSVDNEQLMILNDSNYNNNLINRNNNTNFNTIGQSMNQNVDSMK